MVWPFLDTPLPFGLAHRGGTDVAAENTLAAFSHAVDLGYRYLETDVHRTADGQLVAFHDPDLERVVGQGGLISELSWADLQRIDLDNGERVPRMADLLESFPEARFNIDPKSDDAVEPLIELIRAHNAIHRVCIGGFSDSRLQLVRRSLGPDLCTSPGPSETARLVMALRLGRRPTVPYGCVQIPIRARGVSLDKAWLIERLHDLGLQVHFWTINDESEMRRLLDLGADAVITDEVELLKTVLQSRQQWRPQ